MDTWDLLPLGDSPTLPYGHLGPPPHGNPLYHMDPSKPVHLGPHPLVNRQTDRHTLLKRYLPENYICHGTFRNSHPLADLNALGPGYEVWPDLVTTP